MYQLISYTRPEDINKLRQTFATVFSERYAYLICRKHATGFEDLINKYLDGKTAPDYKDEIEKKLYDLFYHAGFDDEVAFLLGHHQPKSMSDDQKKEWDKYQTLLKSLNRKLEDVNFLAVIDDKKRILGFAVYHLFVDDTGKQILHIRQAAIIPKNRKIAQVFAKELSRKFPDAIYEANRRRGNPVPMKEKLVSLELFREHDACLGYNNTYYSSYRSVTTCPMTLLSSYRKKTEAYNLVTEHDPSDKRKKQSFFWNAEDRYTLNINNADLARASFTDDFHINLKH